MNITDVFAGATVSGTDLVVPLASIPSFDGASPSTDGKELCLGVLLSVNSALSSAGLTKFTTTTSQSASDADTLVKNFTFSAQVSYNFSDLDVEAEPTTTTPAP